MTSTVCGCPPDSPVIRAHSPERCSGKRRPIWSCRTDQGAVEIYDSFVILFASDPCAANPWGLLGAASKVAEHEYMRHWTYASGVARDVLYECQGCEAVFRCRRNMFVYRRIPWREFRAPMIALLDSISAPLQPEEVPR